ncbi:hypothetical protein LSTR_LSTR000044 [Laodelphax striatellus]|uniref:MADF domain-containing protein n=1 Tax=Laodelphax striatellus TaxID=195883 RepID=A0A482X7E1_LAOST|nr:hypothetical protein LSTR_LSTR000044 [Laodelphax striatellus]
MSILRSSLLNSNKTMENSGAEESTTETYGLNFNRTQDKILVDHVAQQPALWQPTHDHYRDIEVKHRIWKEISNDVGKPVETCKKRWKNIKDTYDRKVKQAGGRILTKKDGGRWELNEKLRKFLQSPMDRPQRATKREKRSCNMNDIYVEEVELDDLLSTDNNDMVGEPETILEESCGSPSSQHSATYSEKLASCSSKAVEDSKSHLHTNGKRQELFSQQIKNSCAYEGGSAVDLFFQSLAETVKTFPPTLQQRAKMDALTLINSLELELWNSVDCQ